jgi:hypothetical protein
VLDIETLQSLYPSMRDVVEIHDNTGRVPDARTHHYLNLDFLNKILCKKCLAEIKRTSANSVTSKIKVIDSRKNSLDEAISASWEHIGKDMVRDDLARRFPKNDSIL